MTESRSRRDFLRRRPPLYYSLIAFLRDAAEGQPGGRSIEEGARATPVGSLANLVSRPVDIPAFRQ